MTDKIAILAGARLLTQDGLKKGHIVIEGGLIKSMGNGSVPLG